SGALAPSVFGLHPRIPPLDALSRADPAPHRRARGGTAGPVAAAPVGAVGRGRRRNDQTVPTPDAARGPETAGSPLRSSTVCTDWECLWPEPRAPSPEPSHNYDRRLRETRPADREDRPCRDGRGRGQ